MNISRVEQQLHGYRSGHQLLASSLRLPREDQDTIDRLSDISGPLRPGETFRPYLTMYPLPSGSHYVVARTWQDLSAPRAGCVLTRSLLLASRLWAQLNYLTPLLSVLSPVETRERVSALEIPEGDDTPPPVSSASTIELVEAIFLENRQPVIVFDAIDVEAEHIAIRLLTALWPSVRRNFAICTFALGPRKVGVRAFDLLFAPKSARTRFSDWSGRRIDFSSSYSPRHRWSLSLAERIFHAANPSLTAGDALGVLTDDTRGDESVLRLSLLWNELSEKAPSTPTAVLGLLDILNSQQGATPRRFESLSPQVERALDTVMHSFPEAQAWRFLTTLVGKFPNEKPPQRIDAKIQNSAKVIAHRKPEAAFNFLAEQLETAQTTPAIILAGVADGTSDSSDIISSRFNKIPADLGLQLMSLSKEFSRGVLNAAKRQSSDWLLPVAQALERVDGEMRRNVGFQVIPLLDDAMQAPLLPPLLEGVTPDELAEIAVQIGRKTSFSIVAFDEPLGNAARDDNGLQSLRNAVASQFTGPEADRFLLSTMRVDGQDIAWLCTQVSPERARNLLVHLLESAPDRALVAVQRDPNVRRLIFETLSSDISVGAMQAARILALTDVPVEHFLDTGERLLPYLSKPERDRLAGHLLSRALSQASPKDSRVPRLLEGVKGRVEARELVRWATTSSAKAARVAENLVILDAAPPDIRLSLVSHVDELSDRLVHRDQVDLGGRAYDAWARLISSCTDEGVRFRAASPTLTLALGQPRFAVSSLIVVTFPIVYARLLKSQQADERTIPAFIALPLSFFVDWDRAKSARNNLVDAYLNSSWPPVDLLLTSLESNIVYDTLDRLVRTDNGRAYIRAIEADTLRLDESARNRVLQSLRQFFG
jgi:hypothetical protein